MLRRPRFILPHPFYPSHLLTAPYILTDIDYDDLFALESSDDMYRIVVNRVAANENEKGKDVKRKTDEKAKEKKDKDVLILNFV